MTANTSCIFLDSSDFDPSWFQGGWSDSKNASFVGGSAKVYNGSGKLDLSSLDGSGFTVSGVVPATNKAWTIDITMDGIFSQGSKPTVPNPSPQSWWGTWMDPDDGVHPSAIDGMPEGVVVDFITLLPPFTTSIKGKNIIVDDLDLLLVYTGSWEEFGGKIHETPMKYGINPSLISVPYYGGVTVSGQVGDMIQFPFTGTSIAVYGPLSLENPQVANITVTFDIDNKTVTTATFPPLDAINTYPDFKYLPFYNFFSASPLDAGDHTLTIQIMEHRGGYVFSLDFIVYTAAFDSLDSIPSSTSASLTLPSNPTTASPSTLPPTKPNIGAIAGGVVGGVFFLIIVIAVALYLFRRRRQAALDKLSASPFLHTAPGPEKHIRNGPSHSGESTTFSSEATGATMLTSASTKLAPARPKGGLASLPLGAASPEPPSRSAIDAVQRVRELEQQVQELTGEVQELRPPAYSGGATS